MISQTITDLKGSRDGFFFWFPPNQIEQKLKVKINIFLNKTKLKGKENISETFLNVTYIACFIHMISL